MKEGGNIHNFINEGAKPRHQEPLKAPNANDTIKKLPASPKPQEAVSSSSAQKINDEQQIKYFLAQHNMADSPENRAQINRLLRFNARIERRAHQELSAVLAHIPDAGEEEKMSACSLYANKQALTKENVVNQASYIKENSQMANKFFEINKISQQLKLVTQNKRLAVEFTRLAQTMVKFIARPGAQTAQKMKAVLFRLAHAMGIEKEVTSALISRPADGKEFVSRASSGVLRQVDLSNLANTLAGLTDRFSGSAVEKALCAKLVDLATGLSQNFAGAKLINEAAALRSNEGYAPVYCMNIPIRWGEEEVSNGILYMTSGPYTRGIDAENVRIDVRIETKRLGFMQFVLSIVDNVIQGSIFVENEEIKYLVEENMVDFKKMLLAQFYRINYVVCNLIKGEKAAFLNNINFENLEILAKSA